jgi:hypothetical protein
MLYFCRKLIIMAGKFKMTGFARFFIIMLFVAPLAYIGASYYNGQDGIGNIKRFLHIGETVESNEEGGTDDSESFNLFKGSSSELRRELDELKAENEDLQERLQEQETEIQELKREMRLLRRQ